MKQLIASGVSLLLMVASVHAEAGGTPEAARPVRGIRASIATVRFDTEPRPPTAAAAQYYQYRRNGPAQRITAAIALGTLGALGGAAFGAAVEAPCHCDDPGLKGAMIGAPVGFVLAAIAGYRLAR